MAEQIKKVLWITNLMPGFVANELGIKGTNKEGWIEGTARKIKEDKNIKLAIAFPVNENSESLEANKKGEMFFYGFLEDTNHPENYDSALEERLKNILEDYNPDVIHVFGTEFPHTLALMNLEEWRDKALIHIQGVVEECKKVYTKKLPDKVIKRATFRDILRNDSIVKQVEKYEKRADNENKALIKAKHVLGRTEFDKKFVYELNSACQYHKVNETLRKVFYENQWDIAKVNRHEIFVSQGNYPLKGAHIAIEAIALLREKYPDIKLYIAGDKITAYKTLKDKIKISSYGKYLRELIEKYKLHDNVVFTGALTEREMLERFKKAEIFVLSSFVENSPNSLGEAMLIGMPSVASRVGGVPSLAEENKDVLMYNPESSDELAEKISILFDDDLLKMSLGNSARMHARQTHDEEINYQSLMKAYSEI